MDFGFSVYDGQNDGYLGSAPTYPDNGRTDIGDGDYVTVNRDALIEHAPSVLTLYTWGEDHDEDFSVTGLLEIDDVTYGSPGPAPGRSHGEDDDGEWASAQETYDLPTSPMGGSLPHVVFTMDSDNGGVKFTVYGRIVTTIMPGVGFGFRRVAPRPRGMAVARDIGLAAVLVTSPSRVELITRGPDDGVYRKTIDRAVRGKSKSDWQNLGVKTAGPITAWSGEGGGLHIFVPGPDSTVLHRSWDTVDGAASSSEWQDLGGNIVGQITVIASAHGDIHLFGLDADGAVDHYIFQIRPGKQARTYWGKLGGKFHGPVTAVASQEDSIDIFAVRPSGGVYRKSWDGKEWKPAQHDWEDLGGEFSGSLIALPERAGRIDVFAFVPGGMVHRKIWDGHHWEPSQTDWENIGTVVSLTKSMQGEKPEVRPNRP